jgi:D-alanine-D-alanine ligase
MAKLNVAILFGGKSAEHEVSLRSAKNVIDAIDLEKYNPILIGIDKTGKWLSNSADKIFLNIEDVNSMQINPDSAPVALLPGSNGTLIYINNPELKISIDAVFPILHGPFGEDGTVQGLLKLAEVPFVGPSVLGSSVSMDKDVMKRLLKEANVPIGDYLTFSVNDKIDYDEVVNRLGNPLFIKPANMGSSVGINKTKDETEFNNAIKEAFLYDNKIVIEKFIAGREIECAVLGNSDPKASLPGEIIPSHDFYSYEAKYLDENGASLVIPAKLSAELINKIQTLAVKVFKTLSCEGLSRVDFFLEKDDNLKVIEINTIPGFTSISMYPQLWGATGINYTDLISKLIEFAIERFNKERGFKVSR